MIDSRKMAELVADAADDKKATAITLIDVEKVSSVADYFVVCSGATPIQVKAIAQHIEEKLLEAGCQLYHLEGASTASWVLLDFGVVVVHVMLEREREFYNLERLWNHGKVTTWMPSQELQGAG